MDVLRIPPLALDEPTLVFGTYADASPAEEETYRAVLSGDERERADRFLARADSRRFVLARGLLRTLLAATVGVPAGQLRFAYGAHGKPTIADPKPARSVGFSIAHAGDAVLIAFGKNQTIGVDLETVDKTVPWCALSRRLFAPTEVAYLRALPPNDAAAAYFKLWTAKEAYAKATGAGITGAFRDPEYGDLALRVGGTDPSARGGPPTLRGWRIRSFAPTPGAVAAVAWIGERGNSGGAYSG